MATYQITAPDGNKYRLTGPDNASQQDLINALLSQNPEAGQAPAPPKEGIMAALTGGAKRFGSTLETGLESLIDPTLAAQRGAARGEEISQQYAPGASLEKVKQAYEQKGLFPAAYEAISQIPSALAEQAPNIAASLGGARVGAMAGSPFGPVGAVVGGVGGAFVPSLMQLYGSNLQRQAEEKVPEISRAKALGTAVPGAAAEVASTFIPLGRNLIGKLLGPQAEKALARGTNESIEAAAKEGIATSLAKGAGVGVLAEIPTEVGQQMLERLQAGLPLTTPDALAEYGEAAYGAGLVGAPFGAAARGLGRPAARAEYENMLQTEQAKQDAELDRQAAQAAKEQKEQIQRTQSQLGVPVAGENVSNVLMLPAPGKKYEEPKDLLQDPVGRITEAELGKVDFPENIGSGEVVKYLKAYRKEQNLPPLKSYSLEDIKDAMTAQNPEGEDGALNAILAYKTRYTDETYTPKDIADVALAKNIATGTKGWNDFLTRAAGSSDINQMKPPQLHSVYQALNNLPRESTEEQLVLPEGSNATRFTQEQYNGGVTAALLNTSKDKPVTYDEALKRVQTQKGVDSDQAAARLLKAAAENDDLIIEKGTGFQALNKTGTVLGTYATEAEAKRNHRRSDVKPVETQLVRTREEEKTEKVAQLPEGYGVEKTAEVGASGPAAYVVRVDGSQKNESQTFAEEGAAKDRLNALARGREANAKAKEAAVERIRQDLEKEQAKIIQMEADGLTGTPEHTKAVNAFKAANVTKGAQITSYLGEAEAFRAPLKIVPLGKKTTKVEKHTVTKGGKKLGTFPNKTEAEKNILSQADEQELQTIADRGGAFGKRAEVELGERKRTTPGIKVKGTTEGLEAAGVRTPEVEAKLKELEKKLKTMLDKFGMGNVALNVVRAIENDADGAWGGLNNLIRIAFNADKPIKTMRHEALHALFDLGFFTPQQWEALKREAKKTWLDKYLKNVPFNETMSRFDAYTEMGLSDEAILEEAIADAFGDWEGGAKPPPGMMAALFKRLQQFFTALRQALTGAGFESADEIFGKIERGELKAGKQTGSTETKMSLNEPAQENAWKADEQTIKAADSYEEENGIRPYVSEGFLDLPTDGEKYSLQKYNPEKHLSFDAVLGVPINKNGLITLYYHTTKENAVKIGNKKVIPSEGRSRVYLTNESNGADVLKNRGNFDQEFDGSTVLVYVHPDMLQLDDVQDNGRRDFYIPLAQGDFFNKKMKLQSIQKSRKSAIVESFSYSDHEMRIAESVQKYKDATSAERKKMVASARKLLKLEHNVGTLLTENGKLEKTRVGEYDLDWDGNSVASMGLGLASAQQISEKVSTCPRSGICEGLCLGETSGGNFMFGGAASEDVGDIKKSSFRAAARMMQYLKTEALVVHPEEFAMVLQAEIDSLAKWCASETENKRDPKTKERQKVAKEIYQPAVRLNVTSDFKPTMFRAIIEGNPDTMFYDYTKLGSESIAPNHHLTYSSTGFGQIVKGEKVFFKDKSGKYDHNWATMRSRLNDGQNVAMAFSSKSGIPSFLVDEETGVQYRVWNGDDYDARFLDPKQADGKGMIIGLKNKAGNLKESTATQKTGGFFVQYDPKTDGNTVVVPKQAQFKGLKDVTVTTEKFSLPSPKDPEFKQFFKQSKVVDTDGNPLVVYHATPKDFTFFDPRKLTKNTKHPTARLGFFTAVNPESTVEFISATKGIAKGTYEEGANIMPLYASIQNPAVIPSGQFVMQSMALQNMRKKDADKYIDDYLQSLRNEGHDGILIEADKTGRGLAGGNEFTSDNWVVLDASQLKSAIGNVGSYGQRVPTAEELKKLKIPQKKAAELQEKGDVRFSLRAPDTKEFKQFFKGSKVVDEDGNPLIVYHGSRNFEGDQFKPDVTRINRAGNVAGYYFAPDPEEASEYSKTRATDTYEEGAQVVPVYLNIKNPYEIKKSRVTPDMVNQYRKELIDLNQHMSDEKVAAWAETKIKFLTEQGFPSSNALNSDGDAIQRILKAGGYDGFKDGRHFVAFDPEQIKSATGNIGTFDATNPDIRYSLNTYFPTAEEAESAAYKKAPPGTAEFKRFFGASKAKEEGRPQVMYHASPNEFNTFRENKPIFVSSDAQWVEDYVIDRGFDAKKVKIYPLWVRAETPFDYENPVHVQNFVPELYQRLNQARLDRYGAKLETTEKELFDQITKGNWGWIETPAAQAILKEQGYDSFFVHENKSKNLAVFSASQVKSATGNIGDFSLETKDMRYSLKKVRYSDDRFKKLWDQSFYTQNDAENKTKGYLAFVNPIEFVRATATPEDYERLLEEKEPLDLEGMRNYNGSMYLSVSERDGNWKITGHEGRHRMLALHDAGYTEVPVYIDFQADNAQSIPVKILRAQYANSLSSTLIAKEVEPLSYANKNKAMEKFTRMESKVKYSLPTVSAAAIARRDETTTRRENKGVIASILESFAPESMANLRAAFIHRYNQLGVYDKMLAEKMGGKVLLADVSAEAAANMSDLSSSVTYSAFGIGNRKGGVPVYKNGATTIDNSVKGPLEILSSLAQFNDPIAYQDYQYWAGVKRGKRFMADGREKNFDVKDIALSEEIRKAYLKKGVDFNTIQKEMNTFNDGLVNYMIATGVISAERGAEFKKHMDYIPFFRQVNGDTTVGPKIFNSISGVKPPKQLKGSEAPLTDYLESIVRNTQAAINAGMKNVAAQRAVNVAMQLGPKVGAQRLNVIDNAPDTVQVLENGKQVSYRVADQLFINAVKNLNMSEMPFLGFLSGPANLLRNLVTKDPGFMLANMARDSLSAWTTSGVNITPIASTAANFAKALSGKSATYNALLNGGILGGYEFSTGLLNSANVLEADLNKKYGSKGAASPLRVFTGVWDALEKGTEASDAATRMAVYDRVLADTGNETEALYRALEVMNFNRKGSSPVARILTAAIPFLNARIQGLDVLYRTAFGQNVTANNDAMQKAFFVRGMTLMALSAAYFLAVSDDDEWKKQEQETKDNYWIFPGVGKFPTPFEVGFLFKTVPERIMAYTMKDDTGQDLMNSMRRGLLNTFAFNPIPQVAKPLVEYAANYNFFTGRPIVGQGLEGREVQYQVGPNTTHSMEWLGKQLGLSPIKLEQVYSGYTGTMGMYALTLFDSILNTQAESPNASKRFEQLPVFKRFASDPEARGNITQFYELKRAVDAAVETQNYLLRAGSPEEFEEFMERNAGLLSNKKYVSSIEKTMRSMREMRKIIDGADMTADEKREALTSFGQIENNLTQNIQAVKKMVSEL